MKNIVIGISFSEQSATVLKFGLKLAQFHESTLTVVHIVDYENEEVNNISVPEEKNIIEVFEEFRLEVVHELKAFVKENCPKQFHAIPINIVVRIGYIHQELPPLQIKRFLQKCKNLFYFLELDNGLFHYIFNIKSLPKLLPQSHRSFILRMVRIG